MKNFGLRKRLKWRLAAAAEVWRDRWSAVRSVALSRRPFDVRRRILVIDEMLPDPRFGAGYPRAAALLEAIESAGWVVTMYPMIASKPNYTYVAASFPDVMFAKSFGERGLRRLLQENVGRFHTVLVSRPETMQAYLRQSASVPDFSKNVRCIYDAEALFTVRDRERRKLFGEPMTDEEFEAQLSDELSITRDAQAVLTVTSAEAGMYRANIPAPVHVVSHRMAVRTQTPGFSERRDFLFVGRSEGPRNGSPNVDSLLWFVEEVMPLLDAQIGGDYRLLIAGIAGQDLIDRIGSSRVVFLGIVDDLSALYDSCRVFVAPTRFAAGLPLKLTEAAGAGIPCVATQLLVDQMGFTNGIEIIAADDAAAFAAGCALLYSSPEKWLAVKTAAMARVAVDYSPEHFVSTVRSVLASDDVAAD